MTITRSESHSHRSGYSSPAGSPRRCQSEEVVPPPTGGAEETDGNGSDAPHDTTLHHEDNDSHLPHDSADTTGGTSAAITALRLQMKAHNLAAYIIPSEDAHQSEYTSPVDQRRSFISGFTGSAGIAVVTRDVTCMNQVPEGLAALSTDGRYFTQASHELDFNWRLLKQGVEGEPTWQEWSIEQAIQQSLDSGKETRIGIDPRMITYQEIKSFQSLLNDSLSSHPNASVKIVPIRDNLVDAVWNDKPKRVFNPVLQLSEIYTGESTVSKISRLREKYFSKYGSETMVLNALDEIAWLLNLRGSDIEFNPLFYSYLMIQGDKLTLYTDKHDRFKELSEYLESINCQLKGYDEIWTDLRRISSELHERKENLIVTKASTWKMVNCNLAKNFVIVPSPIQEMKEIKNETELEGQRKAQIKDGFALVRYFSWLDYKMNAEHEFITEYDAGLQLLEFRSELDDFKGLSFETISSTGSNGAIIHYAPKPNDCSLVNPNKLYLCDSGSQFLEGTTDTTRTLHFGTPTQEEIDNYTLVLKGQIALAELKFPEGLTGYQIDCIARQYLWSHGLDYAHGTGHGVDSYGPVHSMGVGIGFRAYCNDNTVKAGHLISDEPGYYKPDHYGIRLENMIICKYDEEQEKTFNGKRFLKFETVTKVPYCRRLINIKMLSEKEKEWLNEFHKSIWDLYGGRFRKRTWEAVWLARETSPL
ncbi:DEKNAAC104232 [Brettanomyces naardenensis]|uniref:Xaa-Pro aminopeptidase n=1 Tax=Brettanomyces naardenensis TaxID=13370 RepID=A0A448YQH3_BRENA|nr:DEKNAAC104232 [Brettanomyces naardenensis]